MLPIRTARLRLRDFVVSDVDAVHAYASDADVTRFMFYGPRTEDETRLYLDRVIAVQTVTPRTLWELAIVRETDDRLIGACDLTFDRRGEADLGFILARDAWGHGYATEAARALVHTAFDSLQASRVFATCDVGNHASARVLEKAGLRREATLERHIFAKGAWWTSFLYAIGVEQWQRPV